MAAILQKLKLSERTSAEQRGSPETRLRRKMVEAINEQIAAAEAELNGQPFMKRGLRYVQDANTGERAKRSAALVPEGVVADAGGHGAARRPLRRPPARDQAEEGGDRGRQQRRKDHLMATLNTLKDAVEAGELDQVLTNGCSRGAGREVSAGRFLIYRSTAEGAPRITYCENGMLRLLHDLGLSWQKARPIHPETNRSASRARCRGSW